MSLVNSEYSHVPSYERVCTGGATTLAPIFKMFTSPALKYLFSLGVVGDIHGGKDFDLKFLFHKNQALDKGCGVFLRLPHSRIFY